ncbi:MAG TPA: hypothetical protein VGJ54_13815 [Streptosporangiaceae bacterium]|jgi:hypothetical protein
MASTHITPSNSPLAVLYGVHHSTVTCAVYEVRPLLGWAWLRGPRYPWRAAADLADLLAYAAAAGIGLRVDGTRTEVRRPRASHPGRRAFLSGKKEQYTIKTTTISDGHGRTL